MKIVPYAAIFCHQLRSRRINHAVEKCYAMGVSMHVIIFIVKILDSLLIKQMRRSARSAHSAGFLKLNHLKRKSKGCRSELISSFPHSTSVRALQPLSTTECPPLNNFNARHDYSSQGAAVSECPFFNPFDVLVKNDFNDVTSVTKCVCTNECGVFHNDMSHITRNISLSLPPVDESNNTTALGRHDRTTKPAMISLLILIISRVRRLHCSPAYV